jgi:magnesium-transporting ATPase (P-type)
MVPEGLILLTSVAFAVSVVRLGRRDVLVQELPAVETLARVDVVCFDKTGTITEGDLAVQELVRLPGGDGAQAEAALGALAGADPSPNATLRAIAAAWPSDGWPPGATVPFSSARKWSAATFPGHGTWLLGAPEVLLAATAAAAGPADADTRPGGRGDSGADSGVPAGTGAPTGGPVGGPAEHAALLRRTELLATDGKRVVLLASAPGPVQGERLPADLSPRAFVVLGDRVRDDARPTVAYFHDQGVATKVVSGDHPRTVAAVAGRVGVPGADAPVDARTLPAGPAELGGLLERRSVFGRVVPGQKRAMVQAMQARGHVVAMTGDGVNDVLALKDADLGIAMGSGSAASRAVARLVLLDGRFASLPQVVAEGRRVIANIERVAKLFVTKTVYAMLLAVATGVAGLPFPFLPRHLTLVGSLTIGIPAFFLALEPNSRRARPGFVRRVVAFAAPAGIAAAAATFTAYNLARAFGGVTLDQERTAATLTLAGIGLLVLRLVELPLTPARRALLAAMAAGLAGLLAVPWLRGFFALSLPPAQPLLLALAMVAVVGVGMELIVRRSG